MPGPQVTLRVDERKLEEVRETLRGVPNGLQRALPAAINRTLATGRTRIKRRIAGELNLKQKVILEGSDIIRATRSTLEGHIIFRRRPVPLMDYGPRQDAAGVSVRTRIQGGEEHFDHYFIAEMPNPGESNNHEGVFDRRKIGNPKGAEGRAGRLPIDEKYGPTVVGVLAGKPGLLDGATGELDEILAKNIDSQVNRLLERRKHG